MLVSSNSIDFVVVLLAAQFAGLRVALANPASQPCELKHVFQLTQPKKVFTPLKLLQTINKAEIPFDQVVTIDARRRWQGRMFVKDIMVKAKKARGLKAHIVTDPSETAYLPFSSGTTGLSKGESTVNSPLESQS